MKVLVGLSGGVDSAVAAYLLKEQGHEVTACFMRNWDAFTNQDILGNPTISNAVCPQEQDYKDAQAVAEKLGIELLRNDYIEEYWDNVFQTFLKEYERGRTPNPDILCNQFIKFDAFFQYAMDHGFDAIATGHYAGLDSSHGFPLLTKASDLNKDQSYFLAQIDRNVLDRVLFPLSKTDKKEVRRIAEELQLDSVSHKKDSTGICFIGERDFKEFLNNYLPAKPGNIVDVDTGRILGKHTGVLYYTRGQRKGLNITAFQGPWYVVGKDVHSNTLYVCHESHQEWLYSTSCLVSGIHWLVGDDYNFPETLSAKFRYRQADQPVHLQRLSENSALVIFEHPIRSVTPGQEAVFYDGNVCLGGGVIEQVFDQGVDVEEKIRSKLKGDAVLAEA